VNTVISTYREALEAIKEGIYSRFKVKKWNKKLGTVYNRKFSTGLYMGRRVDEWANGMGSQATEKRIQIGTVKHYYPKVQVAEIKIENSEEILPGEKFSIIGPTTGLVLGTIEEIWVDEKPVKKAKQGDLITIKVDKKVRGRDKFFVIRKI